MVRPSPLHNQTVVGCADRAGGRVVKSLMTGHAAFPSASRALQCSIEVLRYCKTNMMASICACVSGLHTGRLCVMKKISFAPQSPRPHEMLPRLSGTSLGVLDRHELTQTVGDFEFGEPRSVELKGFPGTQNVYPVI